MQLNVTVTGSYVIQTNSTMNMCGNLYDRSFDPAKPRQNMLLSDCGSDPDNQLRIAVAFKVTEKNVLVITTSQEAITGPFLITTTGPGMIGFVSINISSKKLPLFKNYF